MNPRTITRYTALMCAVLLTAACSKAPEQNTPEAQDASSEKTQAIVLLRGLPTLNTKHSVAIVELDPESDKFGEILQDFEFGEMKFPLHHLYYSPTGRLYATGLDTSCSLAEIKLVRDVKGAPQIKSYECLDTGGQVVGEDIMWHTSNGKEYMFVTFMGGGGLDQTDGGSVGVFDPQTNKVVKIISARKSKVAPGEPYIMYPHGISAYKDRMVIASTVHPQLTAVGNTITIIDLNTLSPIQTIVVEDAKPVGYPSSPVEVLFIRPSIVKDVPPGVLVNTMFGFETWNVPFNEADKTFGKPEKLYNGADEGTGVPLEFYGTETELFISHAIPGVVKRYHLNKLPKLVSSGPDIKAELGAHHMIFYPSSTGQKLIAVQNNLLNLGQKDDNDPTDIDFIAKLNDHSVTVHDLATGERLKTINFKEKYNKGIENIEALFGAGYVHHH
ncbi:MAG: hypothetical protein HRT35_02240 [Algicola sp.]|nr:hypothetical protein [Algicola sp.]